MHGKELRLALVCYGGVSLAVYMHGITKEVWKLLRASRAWHQGEHSAGDVAARSAGLPDSERVYFDLLAELAPAVDLRVLVDIVAGASAGGINGIQLAHAVSGGHDMEPLRDLWLGQADIDVLLDPAAAPRSLFAKLYAWPLLWFARRSRAFAEINRIDNPATRLEVATKLSRFVRSRWFEPPFSGAGFTRLLYESLAAMEGSGDGIALLPDGQPLDLFVTVTDYHGYPEHLALHSPREIVETEHRLVIAFRDDGRTVMGGRRSIGDRAALAFAARATASFPGAFPPAQLAEVDELLAARGDSWPNHDKFVNTAFARHIAAGVDPATARLIDGSVLNNAPFGPAIEALRNRPAHREVDRRFIYIDPKPGRRLIGLGRGGADSVPGFFSTILRSLADIPREQPIRDSVETINNLSRRVRRLRRIVEAMRPSVEAAIQRELGRTLLLYRATAARLTDWRNRVQTAAAREAGFAYPAYAHLKLSQVAEAVATGLGHGNAVGLGRDAVWQWIRARGIDQVTSADFVAFLRRYDLPYRIRRLRFLIRQLTELIAASPVDARPPLEQVKTGLHMLLAPLLDRRTDAFGAGLAIPAGADIDTAMARFGDALDLKQLDAATDAALVALFGAADQPKTVRRTLLLAYLGFPFFDIATLPLLQGEGLDEFDEIEIDRISPDDAPLLGSAGATMLKGIRFGGFGAFFSRTWREHDYLLGRLHAAERLIDIVLTAVPAGTPLPPATTTTLKRRAFLAILAAEREHLTHVPDLISRLETALGADLSTGPSPD